VQIAHMSEARTGSPERPGKHASSREAGESRPRASIVRVLAAMVILVAALLVAGYKLIDRRRVPPPAGSAAAEIQRVRDQQQPAMILYRDDLCERCRHMDALVEMVRRDYQPEVNFIVVNTSDQANLDLVRRLDVGTIPASDFVNASGQATRVVGLMTQQALRAKLDQLAAGK